jgi:mono/diheme cytochrome c family protein
MQKLYAGALRKLTSPPSRILIGVAFVMSIVLGACSPTTITETITITPPPETVTITPSATPTTTPTLTLPPPYAGLENPFLWDDTLAHEDGSVIFQESCAICHVSKEDIPALGVEFGVFDYRQNLEEGPDFYFWTVSEGRPETPMPPWGSILSEEERWQVLTYIWSLGGTVPAPVAEAPAPVAEEPAPVAEEPAPVITGDPTTGQYIFQENCQTCHNIGGGILIGPDLEGVTEKRWESWLKIQIQSPSVHRAQNDPVAMANLAEFSMPMPDLGLTEQQVAAVIAYLKTGETGRAANPVKYTPTLVIGLLAMLGITLIGLAAGTKRVEVRP